MSKKSSKNSRGLTQEEYVQKMKRRKNDTSSEEKSNNKKKKKKPSTPKKKLIKLILLIILIVILILLIKSIIQMVTFGTMAKQMVQNLPSTIVDSDGNEITQIGTERNRENVSIDDIPDNLTNAYVAIEDQRYYSHIGIDVRRTGAATLSYIKNLGKSSFGGSTITQQLAKNLTRKYNYNNFKKN